MFYDIIIDISNLWLTSSNKCSGVKAHNLNLRCSGIGVKVLEIGNAQAKYKNLKGLLKYSILT